MGEEIDLGGLPKGTRMVVTVFRPPYEEDYVATLLSCARDGLLIDVDRPPDADVPLVPGAAISVLVDDIHPPIRFRSSINSVYRTAGKHMVLARYPQDQDVTPFEQRELHRVRLQEVRIQARRMDLPSRPLFDAELIDLSLGGAGLNTKEELLFGTKLTMDLMLPEAPLKNMTGQVVSVTRTSGGYRVGLRFDRITPDARRALRNFVYYSAEQPADQ